VSGGARYGIAAAAIAAVSLAVAIATAVAAVVLVHRDNTRVDTLERKVKVLCARSVVNSVTTPTFGRVVVHTVKGC
jgi:hypothetical protein